MAFMIPVVKNDWDIYKTNRQRKQSNCSNPPECRSRKISESRSESGGCGNYSNTSSNGGNGQSLSSSPKSVPANMMITGNVNSNAAGGRHSQYTRSASVGTSPKSPDDDEYIERSTGSAAVSASVRSSGSQNLSKFHSRVLNKLRKSFKKEER